MRSEEWKNQKPNPVRDKSYAFALRVIELYKFLCENEKEYVLSKQLLRSGTSIGANVEEAIGAQSKRDFGAKMSIAYKESRETNYRLRLLRDAGYISIPQADSVIADCEELCKIIGSIVRSSNG